MWASQEQPKGQLWPRGDTTARPDLTQLGVTAQSNESGTVLILFFFFQM